MKIWSWGWGWWPRTTNATTWKNKNKNKNNKKKTRTKTDWIIIISRCVCVFMCVCVCACLCVCVSICLLCLSVCLSIFLSVVLSVCLSVCLGGTLACVRVCMQVGGRGQCALAHARACVCDCVQEDVDEIVFNSLLNVLGQVPWPDLNENGKFLPALVLPWKDPTSHEKYHSPLDTPKPIQKSKKHDKNTIFQNLSKMRVLARTPVRTSLISKNDAKWVLIAKFCFHTAENEPSKVWSFGWKIG